MGPGGRRHRPGRGLQSSLNQWLRATKKWGHRTGVLRPRQLFELSGWILQEVPEESERRLLRHRIGQYLSGYRRGKLNLPRRFPEPVRRLSELSRADLRSVAYWVKPSMSARCVVDNYTSGLLHRVAPGKVWTRTKQSLGSRQLDVVARLPSACYPRNPRNTWPSSPDIFEILEMSRRGISCLSKTSKPVKMEGHLSRQAVSDDIRLASRIVSTKIVGIRAEIEVPRKFLGHFRSYHGFLILVTRYAIPSGLVRFLLAQWIKLPTSLWLVEHCHFRTFLKVHRASEFLRDRSPEVHCFSESLVEGVGSPELEEDIEPMSIYQPPIHFFTEILILDEIEAQKCFPTFANRQKKGPPFASGESRGTRR